MGSLVQNQLSIYEIDIALSNMAVRSSSLSPVSTDSDYISDPNLSSDDESENEEVVDRLESFEKTIYETALLSERNNHAFSDFYKKSSIDYNFAKNVRALFDNFTHDKAIQFIAKTHVWAQRSPPTEVLPVAPLTTKAVRQFIFVYSTHALYRVVAEKEDKYILLACHMNVHGLHRGDLRFVEVNNRTKTNASKYSCIGHLALGDIVAVTELATTDKTTGSSIDVYKVNQETPCVWMVKKMTLLKRQKFRDVAFAFLENGAAIVMKWGKPLMVKNPKQGESVKDKIYLGNGFIPEKTSDFSPGFNKSKYSQMVQLTFKITKYPFSTGTIFSYKYSEEFTQKMMIGTSAFSMNLESLESESIVELCSLMGSTAVTAVLGGRFDCRSFKMINPKREGSLLKFSIENTQDPKPEGLWKCNTRISVGSSGKDANAVIETVVSNGEELYIVARLSREHYQFRFGDNVHIVSQREMGDPNGLQQGFFEQLPIDSNGHKIITTLYGGPPMPSDSPTSTGSYHFPSTNPIALNEFQNEYVARILNRTPLTLANSPFGCGKSMTIATAAYYSLMNSRSTKSNSRQLLVTQSNYASVNLVDITQKFNVDCRVLRFVTEKNWLELPEESQTAFDLPTLMQKIFKEYVSGECFYPKQEDMIQMAMYLKDRKLITIDQMEWRSKYFFNNKQYCRKYNFSNLVSLFFELYKPDIIIATSDSLQMLLPELHDVTTVQFDEASQVPECSLLQVVSSFPNACFGLVGDIHQLPPYCEDILTGRMKQYGIGNTMERAVQNNMFPKVDLRLVYRCHPVTTQLLGSVFYNNQLIAGVAPEDRNEFMTKRRDFWPNEKCSVMIVQNRFASSKMGTSMGNHQEIAVVEKLIDSITSSNSGYSIKPSDIGIISFYKAQTAMLTEKFRGKTIKCGTVDSFQLSEKEVIILCCTNERVNGFMEQNTRINVAMSRAKQATIVVGNVHGLRKSKYWRSIVNLAEGYSCFKNFIN